MAHKTKLVVATVVLLSIFTSSPPALSKGVHVPKSDDVGYAWIVFNFTFSCSDGSRVNEPEALYLIKWGDYEKRGRVTCSQYQPSSRRQTGKGFVVRLDTRDKPPLKDMKINVSNCTASRIYTEEPPEVNDDRYIRHDGF